MNGGKTWGSGPSGLACDQILKPWETSQVGKQEAKRPPWSPQEAELARDEGGSGRRH